LIVITLDYFKEKSQVDSADIIGRIKQKIRLENIVYLLYYGNKEGNDIDLLAVVKNDTNLNSYHPGSIDLYEMPYRYFLKALRFFDPTVTEPLLTGDLLIGYSQRLEQRKQEITHFCPSPGAIRFLKRRSQQELENATTFLDKFNQTRHKKYLFFALVDLSFACSYFQFARCYFRNPHQSVITLRQLIRRVDPRLLQEILDCLSLFKANQFSERQRIISLYFFHKKTIELIKGGL